MTGNPTTIAVVGAGAMGRGIAQVAALAGCRVLLSDVGEGTAEEARASGWAPSSCSP